MNTHCSLYIIAAPLGNIKDMTYRAVEILRNDVDTVFCEDTRVTRRLLAAYDIDLPTVSLHSHSSGAKIAKAVNIMKNGGSIAYMSDCGTPGISDPGSRLVSEVRKAGFSVIPLPGPSAVTALISVSGFQSKNILFAGFLSKKPGRRVNELSRLAEYKGTLVLYESPHRITKTLAAIAEVFTNTDFIIGREMTKQYEEYIQGNTAEIDACIQNLTVKGEFCIAIDNT